MATHTSILLAAGITASTAVLGVQAQQQATLRADAESPVATATIVKVPSPWYAPRFMIASKMRDTIPLYQSLPGLNFKAYSFARSDGDFGGVYLWKDAAAAKAWFTPEWFERVKRERGVYAEVRLFDVLLAIDNTPGGTQGSIDSAAVATLVEIPLPANVSRNQLAESFAASVPTYQRIPGLLRKYFIVTAKGTFGGIYVWKDEASAGAWFNDAWRTRVEKEYGKAAVIEWFDTPILTVGKEANGTWVKVKAQP